MKILLGTIPVKKVYHKDFKVYATDEKTPTSTIDLIATVDASVNLIKVQYVYPASDTEKISIGIDANIKLSKTQGVV